MPQVLWVGNVAGSGKSTLRHPHGAPSFVYSLAQRRTLGRDFFFMLTITLFWLHVLNVQMFRRSDIQTLCI